MHNSIGHKLIFEKANVIGHLTTLMFFLTMPFEKSICIRHFQSKIATLAYINQLTQVILISVNSKSQWKTVMKKKRVKAA